jgi:pimeloyl-ACP methyl ester carboxylesterase
MIRTFDLPLPHGITLACRGVGQGRPSVVLLHGFPEAAFAWDEVMERLHALTGAVCVAPNLRGYPGSTSPPDVASYRAKWLVADVVSALQALGAPVDVLVAHDWGGAVGWGVAAAHPEVMKRLLIVNAPHPATFLRELRHDPAQQAASAYMNFLCRPDAARLLAEGGHARLWRLFGSMAWMTPPQRALYAAAWGPEGQGLEGPLNYYRASPLRPATGPDDAIHRLELPDAAVTVRVPTTVLWGQADVALLPSLLDGLERWVPDLQVHRVPDASHWVAHEQPDRVVVQIIDSLRQVAA